jgi:hypothetical protein
VATQADMARVRGAYARETQVRMTLFVKELQETELTQAGRIDALWNQLRTQEEASRDAGFSGISRLCRQMQLCLKEAQHDPQADLPMAADTMLTVCRAIQSHAIHAKKRIDALSPFGGHIQVEHSYQ